jgi:hypothetical protein
MAITAGGDLVQIVEPRSVLITNHQIGLVTTQSRAAHQQVVISGRRQRLGKQDPPLEVVDVIVYGVPQLDRPCNDARSLVAHFDAHAFGARQNVLVA